MTRQIKPCADLITAMTEALKTYGGCRVCTAYPDVLAGGELPNRCFECAEKPAEYQGWEFDVKKYLTEANENDENR